MNIKKIGADEVNYMKKLMVLMAIKKDLSIILFFFQSNAQQNFPIKMYWKKVFFVSRNYFKFKYYVLHGKPFSCYTLLFHNILKKFRM